MSIENPFTDHVWSPEEIAARDAIDNDNSGFSIAAFLAALLIVSLILALV